jgi:chromosome segregation ATPase
MRSGHKSRAPQNVEKVTEAEAVDIIISKLQGGRSRKEGESPRNFEVEFPSEGKEDFYKSGLYDRVITLPSPQDDSLAGTSSAARILEQNLKSATVQRSAINFMQSFEGVSQDGSEQSLDFDQTQVETEKTLVKYEADIRNHISIEQ